MNLDTLKAVDELIALMDRPCACEDGSCQHCLIMELLLKVRDDIERFVSRPKMGVP